MFLYLFFSKGITLGEIFMVVISQILYPYARFVYHSVMGFIFGNNMFLVNALVMLALKFFMMLMCWGFAIFIAPIGLLYLYYHHSKEEKNFRISRSKYFGRPVFNHLAAAQKPQPTARVVGFFDFSRRFFFVFPRHPSCKKSSWPRPMQANCLNFSNFLRPCTCRCCR